MVLTLQRLCAMFLVHYGVNLWTLNNELMSAYDVAVASNHVSLALFLDNAASQAFVEDWHGMMKLCRRAAKNARRRLKAQRQSVDVDDRLHSTSRSTDDWSTQALQGEASSSSGASRRPRSLVFMQSPRLADGRLFPSAASDSTDRRQRRRFWPVSAVRRMDRHVTKRDQPSRVAAAARQLLLMSVDDDALLHEAQSRVAREQLRLSSLADSGCVTTDDDNNHNLTPCSGIDCEFYCRPHTNDDTSAVRLSELVNDRTHASVELSKTARSSAVTHKNPASRRHRQTADVSVTSKTAVDKTSTCSDVYTVPIDCIQQPSSRSARLAQTSDNVSSDNDPLRRWLSNNGLDQYWSLLATEKVDVDTVTLLRDEDLRQLGIPLGPRRRLQRAVGQLEQSEQSPARRTVAETTFL